MQRLLGSVATLGFAVLLHQGALAAPADLVLYNGKVVTVDKAFSIHKAIAVKGGKIIAIGGDEIAKQYQAPTRIDLKGRTLLPGFIDAHLHVQSKPHRAIDAADARSITELQNMLRAKAKELGPGQWITGFGWDEAKFSEKRNPSRKDLDVTPNNPVVLTRAGAHSVVGNTLALKLAKIDRNTADPESGLIERDAAGEPNGVIRERSDLIYRLVPPDSYAELRAGYIKELRRLLSLGITSFHSASTSLDDEPVGKGGIAKPNSGLTFRRLQEIHAAEHHTLPRATLYIDYPGPERIKAYPHHSGFGDQWVRLGAIGENAVDGGFTGPTAWTLADYKGQPGFRGKGRFTDAQLQEMIDNAARQGWQMGLHAIGDAAIVQAVKAYDKALTTIPSKDLPQKDRRWFLDHFTIMPPDETMRTMAKDNIMIAQQPNFSYTLEGRYQETMGDARVDRANSVVTPWKKFGIFIAFSADNLPIDPRVGLYAAVTRKGMSGKVHGLEEAVPIADAIRMYTANGAYLSWEEKTKGTLEVGKFADMVVLDRDPLTIPSEQLLTMKVDMTVVGGKVVYDAKARPAPR